ncbi:MAG: hypothetical protein ACSHXD_18180 [Marinosulfonomonas sp.]
MSRPNPTVLFGFFVAVIVAMCGASLLKGGLYLGKHEGDTFHAVEIVLRMSQGQWPHLDFMTPLGVLAFAPIALFVKLGYGVGMAFIMAQTLVSIVLLPVTWWAAYSRMNRFVAYLFGLIIMVLVTSLVHGEAQRSISISMHYNRWAWAIAFIAIVLAVLPPKGRENQTIDGAIIGVAMAALILIKVTYVVAFALPIAVALILHKSYRTIVVAAIAGGLVLLAVSLAAGFGIWGAYISDLLLVSVGGVRPAPGEPLVAIAGAPAYIGGSLTLIAGVIFLRQAKQMVGGLVLLLLAPGFFYVTYQNFANDPQWLLLLGVLLFAMLPEDDVENSFGWNMRSALTLTAAIALAMAAPTFFNLAYSPFRHARIDTEEYRPMLAGSTVNDDLQVTRLRGDRVDARIAFDGPGTGLEAYADKAERDEPTVLYGETLPNCTIELGLPAWFKAMAQDLETAGFAEGKRIFTADLLSSFWLYGSSLPTEGGAPWYYGGLPGIKTADFVLVPLCPLAQDIRSQILETIEERGIQMTEIRRTPLYILFKPEMPSGT